MTQPFVGMLAFIWLRTNMPKRVYKFTTAERGLSNIGSGRLKISTIDDLNDPFDLAPFDTTDPEIQRGQEALVAYYRNNVGLLCFSRNWDNLLLWSHYGAGHSGICCGFDIADGVPGANYDTDVLYQPSVIRVARHDIDFSMMGRLLRTKHESRSYEQEVRVFVGLNDPPDSNGLRWAEFGPLLELREVIIGAQAGPALGAQVREALQRYGDGVRCYWAGMRHDAFLLVREDHPPRWHDDLKVERPIQSPG
jgi:hypothetical protein